MELFAHSSCDTTYCCRDPDLDAITSAIHMQDVNHSIAGNDNTIKGDRDQLTNHETEKVSMALLVLISNTPWLS